MNWEVLIPSRAEEHTALFVSCGFVMERVHLPSFTVGTVRGNDSDLGSAVIGATALSEVCLCVALTENVKGGAIVFCMSVCGITPDSY